ncbi:Uncharacterised protein [Pseudomonas aeruginosa]|nr:Uncharacterised protein [Pseudomonas aeruginosa]
MVVLHGAGEDLRGGGRETVDQYRQRAGIEGLAFVVVEHVDAAVAVAHQYGRALVDEQAGQLGGLLQGAAAVVAQVEDDAVDLVLLQFGDQLLHVAGGALVVRVAGAVGLEVQVEGRQVDHAELVAAAFVVDLDDGFLRRLVLQLHRLAGDGDDLAGLVVRRVARRNHFQAYLGTFRPTDQLDHFIQAPADHVDHFALALGDADDLVGGGDLLALRRRAGRHQAYDLDVVVVALQHRADAFQREAHVDVEVFRVVRRQVLGVRIVGLGEGVDVGLEDVFAAGLLEARQLVLVALGELFLDRLVVLAGDLQAQDLVLHLLAPEVVELCGVLRPGGLFAVDQQALVDAEVDLVDALVEHRQGIVEPTFQAVEVALVDDEAGIEVAALEEVVEPVAPAIELGDVAGGEVHPRRIEHLQVAVVDLGRAFIVQRRLVVVVPLEQFHDVEAGDDLLAVRLQAVPGILGAADGDGGRGEQRQRTGAEEEQQGGTGQKTLHADSTDRGVMTHIRPY